jgi:hypothetical protein
MGVTVNKRYIFTEPVIVFDFKPKLSMSIVCIVILLCS